MSRKEGSADSLHVPQTTVLKVSIHCQGCLEKVKKLLQKIDGVRVVHIDGEEGKVTVSGAVEPEILVRTLTSKGKRVEILSYSEGPQRLEAHLQQIRLERKGTQTAEDGRRETHKERQTASRRSFDVARLKDLMVQAVMGKGSKYVKLNKAGKVDDEGDLECRNPFDDVHAKGKGAIGRIRMGFASAPQSPLCSQKPYIPAVVTGKNLWRQMTS